MNLSAILKTDRIDNKMIVHALNAAIIVSIQVRCHQHLITRKGLLGKLQSYAMRFFVRLNFTRHKGLHILIKIDTRCLTIKVFCRHEFFICVLT